MPKIAKALASSGQDTSAPTVATVVRNAETGELVSVKGAGALAGNQLALRKGIDLLKPIAEQILSRRRERRSRG